VIEKKCIENDNLRIALVNFVKKES